ncbi:hypothetical protein M405DRAFT_274030 [Rhizopogon salebrosus TDB-379]|nr:hypothetical protein M405DRAFT_274030 [Rhizopogon salebrosus TDB-379]
MSMHPRLYHSLPPRNEASCIHQPASLSTLSDRQASIHKGFEDLEDNLHTGSTLPKLSLPSSTRVRKSNSQILFTRLVLPPLDGMNYPTTNMLVRRPRKRRKYYVARLHLRGKCPDQSAEGEIRRNADEDGRRKRGKKGGILEEKDGYAKPFMRSE